MEPGKDLDALVAVKIMGLKIDTVGAFTGVLTPANPGPMEDLELNAIPRFSTRISAAWEVIERLHKSDLTFNLQQSPGGNWKATLYLNLKSGGQFYEKIVSEAVEDTAPHAICVAALEFDVESLNEWT